jgi:hypothetical protein
MPVPSTPVLETFSAALGANWTNSAYSDNAVTVTGGLGTGDPTPSFGGAEYIGSTFGVNQEVGCTVGAIGPGGGEQVALHLLDDNATFNWTGYGLLWDFFTGAWSVVREDSGSSSTTLASGTQAVSVNDKIAANRYLGNFEVWHFSGSWTLVSSGFSDTTYSGGHLGLEIYDVNNKIDDFFGGDVVVSSQTLNMGLLGVG